MFVHWFCEFAFATLRSYEVQLLCDHIELTGLLSSMYVKRKRHFDFGSAPFEIMA